MRGIVPTFSAERDAALDERDRKADMLLALANERTPAEQDRVDFLFTATNRTAPVLNTETETA